VGRQPEDQFPSPTEDSRSTAQRPVPASMGGGTRLPGNPLTASRALIRRGPPNVDPQASATFARHLQEARPRLIRQETSGVVVVNKTLILNLGGPKAGFEWTIRRINVGPVDYSAGNYQTVSTVIAIVGPQETSLGVIDSAAQVVSQTTAFPAEGTWGLDELPIAPGDHLRVLVVGYANPGDTITAAAVGWETVIAAQAAESYPI
jgi:hypothetical protein